MHDHQSVGKLQVSVLNTLSRWQFDWLKDQSMIKGKNFVSASTNDFFIHSLAEVTQVSLSNIDMTAHILMKITWSGLICHLEHIYHLTLIL